MFLWSWVFWAFPPLILPGAWSPTWVQGSSWGLSVWVQSGTSADLARAGSSLLHLRMVRAFSKAVWQRWLVLGSGVGCSSSPLCWCPSVVSLPWLPVGSACLAPCACSAEVEGFILGRAARDGWGRKFHCLYELGLDPACKYYPFPCFSDA